MEQTRGAGTCRHAVPTLFMDAPTWMDATERPWTCVREAEPRELESTDVCRACAHWAPRPEAAEAAPEHPQPYFLDILAH